MRVAAFLCAFLLAGCAGRAQIEGSSNTSTAGAVPPPGTRVSNGSVGLSMQGSSLAGAVIAVGVAAAAMSSSTGSTPLPELAPGRLVNEQDCARPIEDSTANLKCR